MSSKAHADIVCDVAIDPTAISTLDSQEQLTVVKKGRPRGRPWAKGASGNAAGRKRGCLNKFSQMVMEATAKNRPAPPPGPDCFDPKYPFFRREHYLLQRGRRFDPVTLQEVSAVEPDPPRTFDRRRRRDYYDLTFEGRRCLVTPNAWVYDAVTLDLIQLAAPEQA